MFAFFMVFVTIVVAAIFIFDVAEKGIVDDPRQMIFYRRLQRWTEAAENEDFYKQVKLFKKLVKTNHSRTRLSYLVSEGDIHTLFNRELSERQQQAKALWKLSQHSHLFNEQEQNWIEEFNQVVTERVFDYFSDYKLTVPKHLPCTTRACAGKKRSRKCRLRGIRTGNVYIRL